MNPVLSIEFGGQSIKTAVVDPSGNLIACNKLLISQAAPPAYEKFERDFLDLLSITLGQIKPSAAGIAHPNPCDPKALTFMLAQKPAYRYINGHPLKDLIFAGTGLSEFHTIYDAGAAGLGEHWQGKVDKDGRFLLLTLGTGLGAVFLVDGLIATGQHVHGIPKTGELWDYQFRNTDLENITGTTKAAVAIYQDLGGKHPDILAGDLGKLASMARENVDGGIAQKTFAEFGERLGEGIAPIVKVFHPKTIILSGNIARAYDLFGPAAEQAMKSRLGSQDLDTSIVKSDLIDKGGLLGAAYRALHPERPYRLD